jgi:heme/copper-type cytochrome/quinol oxidase subunit 2
VTAAADPGPGRRVRARRLAAALGLTLAATVGSAQTDREIVISNAGFRPPVINVKKGEPTRLLLRSADGEHCFSLDALRIEKRVVPGKPTAVELTADRAGNFPFYDCLNPERKGRLAVSE